MPAFEESTFSEASFCGTVRLFPLPDLVLFPHVLQPLHVFEPRYLALVRAALASDGLIAVGTLLPGWEPDYEGRPPVYPMACLGRIVSHHQLDDGSYNILLLGVKRVRLVRELAPAQSFREVQVELCDDFYPVQGPHQAADLAARLRQGLLRALPRLPQAQEQVAQLLSGDMPLGTLADVVAYLLEVEQSVKERLLAEPDVFRRVVLLLAHMASAEGRSPTAGVFPPAFSEN